MVDLEVGERRPEREAQAGQAGAGTGAGAGADGVASRLDQRPEHESLGAAAMTAGGQQGGGQ